MAKKGKYEKVDGPIRSFFLGVGGFGTAIVVIGAFIEADPSVLAGLVITIPVLAVGAMIPQKNRVEW